MQSKTLQDTALHLHLPHPGSSIDLIHGSSDSLVRLNISDQSLDDHETKGAHALGQLVLHLICNLLLGLHQMQIMDEVVIHQGT